MLPGASQATCLLAVVGFVRPPDISEQMHRSLLKPQQLEPRKEVHGIGAVIVQDSESTSYPRLTALCQYEANSAIAKVRTNTMTHSEFKVRCDSSDVLFNIAHACIDERSSDLVLGWRFAIVVRHRNLAVLRYDMQHCTDLRDVHTTLLGSLFPLRTTATSNAGQNWEAFGAFDVFGARVAAFLILQFVHGTDRFAAGRSGTHLEGRSVILFSGIFGVFE
jgi:hypothetical protein